MLNLNKPPKSLIIVGSGYIGCEYGHFFSSLGTEVTILGRSREVLINEDPEIRALITKIISRYMNIFSGHEVVRVDGKAGLKLVTARNLIDENLVRFEAEEILVAAGRRSNSDLLKPEKTGVELDKKGWIRINDYLETTKPGIWAIGDAIGKHMFRHTANYEAKIVYHNITRAKKNEEMGKIDFHSVPHAVFSHPPVSAVGMKEEEAVAAGFKILVGRAKYNEVAKGIAMAIDDSLVKVVAEEETGRILGCSVVGPFASELVQQIVYLMNTERQNIMPIIRSQVIHPTISEVIIKAFNSLEHPFHHQEEMSQEIE